MNLSLQEIDDKNYAINNAINEKYEALDQKLNDVGYSINNHERESKERDLGINGHIDQSKEAVVNEIRDEIIDVIGYIDFIKPTIVQTRRNTDHILKHLNVHLILLILLGVVSISSLVFDIILLCLMG